jgi:hypothetical protein
MILTDGGDRDAAKAEIDHVRTDDENLEPEKLILARI